MSTIPLTMVVVVVLIAGLFAASVMALYRRRLATASVLAAAGFAILHLAFIAIAWRAAATVAEDVAYPAVASLPTAVYDAPAWAAVAFSVTGIVLAAIERHRRKVAEKEMAAALMHFFGVNKDDKSEED